jgi:hypothetical protein
MSKNILSALQPSLAATAEAAEVVADVEKPPGACGRGDNNPIRSTWH